MTPPPVGTPEEQRTRYHKYMKNEIDMYEMGLIVLGLTIIAVCITLLLPQFH